MDQHEIATELKLIKKMLYTLFMKEGMLDLAKEVEEKMWPPQPKFIDGPIDGVAVTQLSDNAHGDRRGWLAEIYRVDETPCSERPRMAYISLTKPRASRGPHSHQFQTDRFLFASLETLLLYLWDDRPDSKTYRHKMIIPVGGLNRCTVLVPPGVVHGYTNIDALNAVVINFPNRLYCGEDRKEEPDELRYEDDPDTPFKIP